MKKITNHIYRMLFVFAVATFMFFGLTSSVHAANDEIVIDLSNGRSIEISNRDEIDWENRKNYSYTEDEKQTLLLSNMIAAGGFRGIDLNSATLEGNNISCNVVLNTNPQQNLCLSAKDYKALSITANNSQGTYEGVFAQSTFTGKPVPSAVDDTFAIVSDLYGINATNAKGERYFKLKLIFNNPQAGTTFTDENGKVETTVPEQEFVENGYSYKVIAAGEVEFTGITNKNQKSVNIPDSVDHQNVTYKVTAVANKALYNNKKIKRVTIGSNVTTIGRSAFAKCKKLKKVTIKTTVLKSMGKKAFNKNDKDLVVKVAKSKYKVFKRYFKKAGITKVNLQTIK